MSDNVIVTKTGFFIQEDELVTRMMMAGFEMERVDAEQIAAGNGGIVMRRAAGAAMTYFVEQLNASAIGLTMNKTLN